MSNYIMQVDFFGNNVRAESEGSLVSLTDIVKAGNKWRADAVLPLKTLQAIVESVGFQEFLKVTQVNKPDEEIFFAVGKGNQRRTMAHVILAIYVAEQLSPEFHYKVIETFVEGKLLEFRELGGTEFKNLNAAIDLYLPGRKGKDNKGVYITTAIALRKKLLGENAVSSQWAECSVAQTHSRYAAEQWLVKLLQQGLVRDFEHLKELISKV